MIMSKISVVVPVHNSEKTLKRCIDSILSQTYKDFELILIDDGSQDSSLMLCREAEKNDKRVRCIHIECRGVSFVRNLGIDEAKGEYIVFADSDDYLDVEALQFMYRKAVDTNADIVLCGYKIEDGDSVILNNCEEMLLDKSNINQHIVVLKSKHLIDAPWNKMYNLDFLRKTNVKMPVGEIYEDTAFNLDLLTFEPKISVHSECFYHYVQNMGSITKKYNPKKLELIKKRARQLKEVTTGIDSYCDFYFIKSVLSAVIDMFLSCDKSEIKRSITDIAADSEFKKCAAGADFEGAKNKLVIFVSRSSKVWLIYVFCKITYLLKYRAKKVFMRMRD